MHLYHGTSRDNRDSILQRGLLRPVIEESTEGYKGGVFFHTVLSDEDVRRESIDVWRVDVTGIELERDTTTEHEDADPWMVAWYQDVEPWRLTLCTHH